MSHDLVKIPLTMIQVFRDVYINFIPLIKFISSRTLNKNCQFKLSKAFLAPTMISTGFFHC